MINLLSPILRSLLTGYLGMDQPAANGLVQMANGLMGTVSGSSPENKYTIVIMELVKLKRYDLIQSLLVPVLSEISINEILGYLPLIDQPTGELLDGWVAKHPEKIEYRTIRKDKLKGFTNTPVLLNLLDVDEDVFNQVMSSFDSINWTVWLKKFGPDYLDKYELLTNHTRFRNVELSDFDQVSQITPIDSFVLSNALFETTDPARIDELINLGAPINDSTIRIGFNNPAILILMLSREINISPETHQYLQKQMSARTGHQVEWIRSILDSSCPPQQEITCAICKEEKVTRFSLVCTEKAQNSTFVCPLCAVSLNEIKCPTCRGETLIPRV